MHPTTYSINQRLLDNHIPQSFIDFVGKLNVYTATKFGIYSEGDGRYTITIKAWLTIKTSSKPEENVIFVQYKKFLENETR
jgi:hypothetical protein